MPLPYRPLSPARPVTYRYRIVAPEGQCWLFQGALPAVTFEGHGLAGFWCVEACGLLKKHFGVQATVLYAEQDYAAALRPDGSMEVTLVVEVHQQPTGGGWARSADFMWPENLSEWQQPGWFVAAVQWIQHHLGPVQVIQLNTTPKSVMLQAAEHIFKVSSETEGSLTRWLHQHHPHSVPEVVALWPEQGAMLSRNIPGPLLTDQPDLKVWEKALDHLGHIQQHSTAHLSELQTLGVPVLDLAFLLVQIEDLLQDSGFLEQQKVSLEQINRLQQNLNLYREAVQALQQAPLPTTLVHGDFHPYNVIGEGVLIDWNEALLGPPLLDVACCLGRLPAAMQGHHDHLRDQGLHTWTTHLPLPELQKLYQHARKGICLWLAVKGRTLFPDTPFAGFQLKRLLACT